eukprot:363868-Chlamydomonas_euryale.AAC.6
MGRGSVIFLGRLFHLQSIPHHKMATGWGLGEGRRVSPEVCARAPHPDARVRLAHCHTIPSRCEVWV